MFHVNHTNMEVTVIPTEQLRTLIIESVSIALKYHQPPTPGTTLDVTPYGDFIWLKNTCSGIPASTLRIKSAGGEIPGVIKFGKRVLYEKATVISWLRSQTKDTKLMTDNACSQAATDEQIHQQLNKKGGAKND